VPDLTIPEAGFRVTFQMSTDEKKFTAIVRHFMQQRARLRRLFPDVLVLNTGTQWLCLRVAVECDTVTVTVTVTDYL
jgi:hypothetical protein